MGKFSLGATTKLVAFIFLNFVLHDPLLVQLTSMKKAGHACVGLERRKRQIEQLLKIDCRGLMCLTQSHFFCIPGNS